MSLDGILQVLLILGRRVQHKIGDAFAGRRQGLFPDRTIAHQRLRVTPAARASVRDLLCSDAIPTAPYTMPRLSLHLESEQICYPSGNVLQ